MPNDGAAHRLILDQDVVAAALPGLLAPRKTLPPKLFYDEAGCALFYRITGLPEYYLTRTERVLLTEMAVPMLHGIQPGAELVEYGASDEAKALTLLRVQGTGGRRIFSTYVPIDVAGPALVRLHARLRRSDPGLAVHPVVADFMNPVTLPPAAGPRVGFFPGSTIGNLEPDAAVAFLARARTALGGDASFILGADLRKDPAMLIPAYDDSQGVTAAFNRNLLVRLNREAGANFDPAAFAHRAIWNSEESRIEMHLVSGRSQVVHVAGRPVWFDAGETIHTENSYKHTPERLTALAARAGWHVLDQWTDPDGWFALFRLA